MKGGKKPILGLLIVQVQSQTALFGNKPDCTKEI
jgi:hypothetical protein